MTMRILAKGTLAVVVLGGLLASTYGCDQQKPKCAAGRGAFMARYIPVAGPPSCADTKGEVLGFSTYNQVGEEEKPNLDAASIAIQAEPLGLLADNAEAAGVVDADPAHKQYALGSFASGEPVDDFCVVPTFAGATQTLPAIAEDAEHEVTAQPATTIVYNWSDVRLYVTAQAYGTQFTGNLIKITDGVQCQYRVVGMYPYVPCGAEDPADPTKEVPDEAACAPEADADAGRPTGSGINPDFPTRCDPELLACVLASDTIPALR